MNLSFEKTPTSAIVFSADDLIFQIASDVAETVYVNAQITLRELDSGNFIGTFSEVKATVSNTVSFDLKIYADAYLNSIDSDFIYDVLVNSRLFLPNNCSQVDVKFWAENIDGATISAVDLEASYTVILGKTDIASAYILPRIQNYGPILSLCTSSRFISEQKPAVFSFFNAETRTIKLYVEFDANRNLKIMRNTLLNAGVVHFYFSYSHLRAMNGGAFSSAKIWMRDASDNNISSVVNFTFSEQVYENSRLIFFSNRVGGLECVQLIGDNRQANKLERQTVVRDNRNYTTDINTTRNYEIDTGYYAAVAEDVANYRTWLIAELFASKNCHLLTDSFFAQIRLTNDDVTVFEDKNFLASNKIEFEITQVLQSFTAAPPLEIWGEDFTLDFNNDFNILI